MGNLKRKRNPAYWKLESKVTTTVYTFDTVEDSPYLCRVTVRNGTVVSYDGVFALDREIVRRLEAQGVTVPKDCRYV